MSRTPLFRVLQRALAQARYANQSGLPAEEILALSRAPGISRRRFVASTVAAGAGIALGGCSLGLRGGRGRGDPVIIVGAGIAGLTAAYRLRQAGVPVAVFEAQNRVGGRMLSLRGFFPDGQVCELGGELIDTNHTALRSLCDELGIALDDLSVEGADIATDTWFFGGARRSDIEVIEAFRPVARQIQADVAPLDADITYRSPAGAAALDRISIAEWLDRNNVTGWIRSLIDVGYTTEYGLEIGEQSALNLLLMIDPNPLPFRIFGDSDERFHVRGGNDLVTTQLAGRLEDAIQASTVLEAVSQRADGRFTCTFRRGSGTFEVHGDDVILAVPFTLLRDVSITVPLPRAKRLAIDTLAYGTNAKLMVGFSGRAWRTRYRTNGSVLTDLPFQLAWETSRAQDGSSGILTNFTGGRHGVEIGNGASRDRAADFVRDLERVFPGVAAERAGMRESRMHWPTHPWVRGSYASYAPGQWTTVRGAEGEAVGRLHFAGEHTSLRAQGFMEGGCESGERAAREVLASRGLNDGAAADEMLEARPSPVLISR